MDNVMKTKKKKKIVLKFQVPCSWLYDVKYN